MAYAHPLLPMSTEGTRGIIVAGLPSDEYAPTDETNVHIDELVHQYCSEDPKMDGIHTLGNLIHKWTPRMRSLAHTTASKCSDPMFDQAEIEARLTIQIWLSVTSFDPTYGSKLSTWIFGQLSQCCGLIIEGQYNKRKGVSVLDINASLDDDPDGEDVVGGMQICRADATPPDIIESYEQVDLISGRIKSIMRGREDDSSSELYIFNLIMGEESYTDSEIAHMIGCDWAKVGDVRLKCKVAIAILCQINFCNFTKSKQLEKLARRVASALGVTNFEKNVQPLLDAEEAFDNTIWDSYTREEFAVVLADV